MKKLFAITVLLFAFAVSEAQITTLYMSEGQSQTEYKTNVTLTNNVAQYFLIKCPIDYYTAQVYCLSLDSLTGNHTKIACVLAGRYTDETSTRVTDTWTTISTTNWGCTKADTVFCVVNGTENGYNEFKLTLTGTGTGTSQIDNFEFMQKIGIP